MATTRRTAAAVALGLLASLAASALFTSDAEAGSVPDDAARRMTEAAPQRATVKPKRPRKLLVFNLCRGFKHGSIPFCSKAMEIMGRRTGAYEAVPSEDTTMFRAENLRQFDAVLMNNTTGELFNDEAMKRALVDFVKGGKGIVGVHAATDCFYRWAEYGEMMGGYFDGHPWSEKVGVKLDDPTHPLMAAFGGQGFEVNDEIYQFKDPYSRKVLRVLMSLDVEKINMNKGGIKREDKDFAVSWVRSYGKGRVFYCSLGHRNDIFWNPKILRHYLDGIQFALGDLEADTTPVGAVLGPGFLPLFNGKDLTGWEAKPRSWVVRDGNLVRVMSGDIWTEAQFGDFVLDLEFALAPYAKSGILLRGGGPGDRSNPGIEVEICDSSRTRRPGKSDCGAIYGCLAPSRNACKKPGEWNRMVIAAQGSKIRVTLNGSQVVDADLEKWDRLRRNPDNSFNMYPKALKDMPRSGRIGLQGKSGRALFRNIRVSGGGGAGGGGDSELRKVDGFTGDYAGKLTQGGRSVEARVQVVAQSDPQGGGPAAAGDRDYKVVLLVGPSGAAGTSGAKRFELGGRSRGGKLTFSGDAEGVSWQGELANDRLVAVSRSGKLDLSYAPRSSPTLGKAPPRGAIVLLPFGDGPPSLDQWTNGSWKPLPDGSMQVGKGDNRTKRQLADGQYHLEFMTPYMPKARGQGRGNSGVYIHDRYEVQVLDSFGLVSQSNDCGAIYKVATPKVNACQPPLTWQTYDITFRRGAVTVVHNGVTIHENQHVGGAGARGPLKLQDHGNPVRYRNIWIVEFGAQSPRR